MKGLIAGFIGLASLSCFAEPACITNAELTCCFGGQACGSPICINWIVTPPWATPTPQGGCPQGEYGAGDFIGLQMLSDGCTNCNELAACSGPIFDVSVPSCGCAGDTIARIRYSCSNGLTTNAYVKLPPNATRAQYRFIPYCDTQVCAVYVCMIQYWTQCGGLFTPTNNPAFAKIAMPVEPVLPRVRAATVNEDAGKDQAGGGKDNH